MSKEHQTKENDGSASPAKSDSSRVSNVSVSSSGSDLGLPTCRVCQCVESDKRGDIVLGFLGIIPPVQVSDRVDEIDKTSGKEAGKNSEDEPRGSKGNGGDGLLEFISPEGEVFVCNDVELGLSRRRDALIELGCSCKSDLALVHYACALKWFINHGSTVCEICGSVATNVRSADFKKVLTSLKDYETLREMTVSGVPNPIQVHNNNSGVDPDAVAAIRRQRLSEISLWFNPHNSNQRVNDTNDVTVAQSVVGQPLSFPLQNVVQTENPATRWAVEGTAILLATGLLTVIFAWLIAPHVGKKTARSGLNILLGGVCALAIVIFFRIIVLSRIRYGPARYWAILFVFWFLVFGIWASRTHAAHTT